MDRASLEPERTNSYWDNRGLTSLWLSVFSGPAAWTLNQLVGYALIKPLCAGGSGFGISILAIGALAFTALGGWNAWRCYARLRHAELAGGTVEDRSLFLAIAGLSLNALLGLLILTSATQPFFLSPCE